MEDFVTLIGLPRYHNPVTAATSIRTTRGGDSMRLLCLFLLTRVLSAVPAFEVATIRPHEGEIRRVTIDIQSTLVTVTAMTVRELIAFAYDLREYQVQGGDAWIAQTRWDIQASAGALEPTRPQARQMLQGLLAERFGLSVRRSSQALPVYAMTIAKGGAKLKPPTPFDSERSTFNADGAVWQNAPLDILGNPFPLHLDRPLVNRTGLTGRYDFELKFKLSLTEAQGLDGESIYTAMEEQLGLHVQPDRAAVEVLVVEQIRRPGEN
jgi:bla regulator protein blaR1